MMGKNETDLERSLKRAGVALSETNAKIEELGSHSSKLCDNLGHIQDLFDRIRNVPEKKRLEFGTIKKVRLEWKQQAQKIESDYAKAQVTNAGKGAAGAGAGVAFAALGPTAAMGIATTFGVASTGTAISTLSGAAATNAALAWLGGGALVTGGGGMAAGEALLTLAGPVGWAIAGVALLGSGIMLIKGRKDKQRIENVFTLISERDANYYKEAIVELDERINRIVDESGLIEKAIERIASFGDDYNAMSEAKQFELGSYVNLMNSSTRLLVNPIRGLQPRYTEDDFNEFIGCGSAESNVVEKKLVVYLCNLLWKIDLDDKDSKLLRKSIRKNKELLSQLEIKKAYFKKPILDTVQQALRRKYQPNEVMGLSLSVL